ncbi:MAG: DUF4255 domain-containing protein [Dokdonella sp.]
MSNSLAIATTTLTLQQLLQEKIPQRDSHLPGFTVTTLPPDIAQRDTKSDPRLNIFLYQTTVNAAWRNLDVPSQTRQGELGRPLLALNLHYLLTAYCDEADPTGISHRVLGGAMSVLHDFPLLDRTIIRGVLANNDLADQFERVRVTPLTLPMDEMSKLWTALQTNYRVSAGYEVSVLLIDSQLASRAALPVLKRGADARGPSAIATSAPLLDSLRYPRAQPAACLGDEVVLVGSSFDLSKTSLRFSTPRLTQALTLAPQAGDAAGEIKFQLPALNDAVARTTWVPGLYTVAAVVGAGDDIKLVSNELAFALAPAITITPTIITPPGAPTTRDVAFVIAVVPQCREGQRVLLVVGDRQVEADKPDPPPPPPDPTQPYEPAFTAIDVGRGSTYTVRLRVDGIDSLPVLYSGLPALPTFDPNQQVTVP